MVNPSTCKMAMSLRFSVTDRVSVETIECRHEDHEVSNTPTVIFSILIAANKEP